VLRSNCALYVHGHSAGGTNPSLVEAMCLGLPVLAFHASFNKATTENKAIYFGTKDELKQHIKATTISTWLALGLTMQSIADRRYNWAIIARKYNYLIHKVSSTVRQGTKGGLSPQLSELTPAELVQHQLGQYAALKMFYDDEV
jgi:glycosyltransferase involved in cell wall biosynthesis